MTFETDTTPHTEQDNAWGDSPADVDELGETEERDTSTTAADEDELDDTLDEDDDEGQGKHDARSRATRTQASRVTPRQVRTAIAKYRDVVDAPEEVQSLTAAILGVKADPVEITAQVVATQRVSLPGLGEVEAISAEGEKSPFQAMAKAIAYESLHRQIWTVLSELALVSGNAPQKETSAAMRIAEAATMLTDAHRELFDSVRALTRKGA